MTKNDYIRIARALRDEYAVQPAVKSFDWRRDSIESCAAAIAVELEDDNAHFNREHFLAVVRGERALESRPPRKGKGEKR